MIQFTTTILQFKEQGEKTGWTYIKIPADLAQQLLAGNKKSFRVKGRLDQFPIKMVSLLPMGKGDFIMPLKAEFRKALRKKKGAMLDVKLELDKGKPVICPELIQCLKDEPSALERFNKMPGSHQLYYSKWIESAKTEPTRAKRIAMAVTGLARGMDYGEMLRAARKENELLGKGR